MSKVWVLDTFAKGTGASVVPLERTVTKPSSAVEPVFVPRKPAPRPTEAPEPRPQRSFRVVDVMTREVLVADGTARETVDALEQVRSIVDVDLYVWQPTQERWRMLTFGERRAMWELQGTTPSPR
jgi:hypothetical protein